MVTTSSRNAVRCRQLTELKWILPNVILPEPADSNYVIITSPCRFFSLWPTCWKLLLQPFHILPELLRIPFVPNFLWKDSQLSRNRVREITKNLTRSGYDNFPLGWNTTAPAVLTRIPIGLNSCFLANKINRYFFVHFLMNDDSFYDETGIIFKPSELTGAGWKRVPIGKKSTK